MERHTSIPFESFDEPKDGMGNPSPPYRFGLTSLLYLLQHRPLMFWGSVWASLFLIIGIATLILTNPASSKRAETLSPAGARSQAPLHSSRSVELETHRETLPFWSLGAIAFSCAMGSVLLAKKLQAPASPKTSRRSSAHTSALTVVPEPLNWAEQPIVTLNVSPVQSPLHHATAIQPPVVTVVPAEQSTPLDWDEPSLADMMDIRRRRSMSSWM